MILSNVCSPASAHNFSCFVILYHACNLDQVADEEMITKVMKNPVVPDLRSKISAVFLDWLLLPSRHEGAKKSKKIMKPKHGLDSSHWQWRFGLEFRSSRSFDPPMSRPLQYVLCGQKWKWNLWSSTLMKKKYNKIQNSKFKTCCRYLGDASVT